MWTFDLPNRDTKSQRNEGEKEGLFFVKPISEENILSDLSPGQRIAVWFHSSGFIEGQFEGFQRGYALFLTDDCVIRIRVTAIQAVAIL